MLTEMQKQQGIGPTESDHSNAGSFTKYQVLVSSDIYGQKPSVARHQVTQPAVANQEVIYVSKVAIISHEYNYIYT